MKDEVANWNIQLDETKQQLQQQKGKSLSLENQLTESTCELQQTKEAIESWKKKLVESSGQVELKDKESSLQMELKDKESSRQIELRDKEIAKLNNRLEELSRGQSSGELVKLEISVEYRFIILYKFLFVYSFVQHDGSFFNCFS